MSPPTAKERGARERVAAGAVAYLILVGFESRKIFFTPAARRPSLARLERASGVAVQRPPVLLNRVIMTVESYLARCDASLSTAYACATALKSPSAVSRSSALGALSG